MGSECAAISCIGSLEGTVRLQQQERAVNACCAQQHIGKPVVIFSIK